MWYGIRSAKDARKRRAAQSVAAATEECWAILRGLAPKDAKKVLASLKDKLTPKTTVEPHET